MDNSDNSWDTWTTQIIAGTLDNSDNSWDTAKTQIIAGTLDNSNNNSKLQNQTYN